VLIAQFFKAFEQYGKEGAGRGGLLDKLGGLFGRGKS
jgi:hypothetical protein